MVQTVVRFFDGRLPDGTAVDDRDCRNPNPTQSGGAWANTAAAPTSYGRTEYWMGSPVLAETRMASGAVQIECRNLRTGVTRRLLANSDGTVRVNQADDTCGEDDGDPWTSPDDHAVLVTRRDGSFGYAVVRLGLVVGEMTTVTFRCAAAPCSTPDRGAVIIQPLRTQFTFPARSTVAKGTWGPALDTFLVVNNRSALLTRSDEIRADGGTCLE